MKKLILFMLVITCLLFVGCNKDNEETPEATTAGTAQCEHEWGEVSVTTEPTCTTHGEGERKCSLCGVTETVEVKTEGHKVTNTSYTDNPTFLQNGRQKGKCEVCGKSVSGVATPLVMKYKTVPANLTSVNNVYFNGFWTDAQTGGANAAYTNMLGSEIVAKVKGASKITYNFAISDATKSAVVAYTTDGINWTRQDLKSSATLSVTVPADETVVRVMFVETAIDMTQSGAGLYLKSVAADKGEVVPCVKNAPAVLLVSDKVTDIEKDVLTLTAENLGYTNWRMSLDGLGCINYNDILDAYANAQGKTTLTPEFIILDIGANDADSSAASFRESLVGVVEALTELYPETDILLLEPENSAHIGELESVISRYGCAFALDRKSWESADVEDSYKALSDILVAKYGEKTFFDGYYSEYAEAEQERFPTDKEEDREYGDLIELT